MYRQQNMCTCEHMHVRESVHLKDEAWRIETSMEDRTRDGQYRADDKKLNNEQKANMLIATDT